MAVDLPESVKEKIADIQKQIDTESARVVFVKPEHLHVTIRFLGEVAEFKVGRICRNLENVRVKRFSTKFTNFGFFPDRRYIRVFWMGLSNDSWYQLSSEIEEQLTLLGFSADKGFTPHLTIARIKFVRRRKRFLESCEKIKTPKAQFDVSSFKLKKSELTPLGPVYNDIAVYPLSE